MPIRRAASGALAAMLLAAAGSAQDASGETARAVRPRHSAASPEPRGEDPPDLAAETAATLQEGEPDEPEDDALSRPLEWLPSRGRQCRRHRRRRVCDGPRMVPRPHGAEGELAQLLGLGSRRASSILQLGPPEPEWVDAVRGEAPDRLRWPVQGGKLWRGFGRVRHRGRRRFHKGVDIGAREGTPILAAADGLVAYSNNGSRGYGNLLIVVHADASVAFYAHCRATYLFPGQQVRAGQVVGEVGTTGITQGAHLHFELRTGGEPVDPLPLFEEHHPSEGRAPAPDPGDGTRLAHTVPTE